MVASESAAEDMRGVAKSECMHASLVDILILDDDPFVLHTTQSQIGVIPPAVEKTSPNPLRDL